MSANDWGTVWCSVPAVDMLANICKGHSYLVGKGFLRLDPTGLSSERLADPTAPQGTWNRARCRHEDWAHEAALVPSPGGKSTFVQKRHLHHICFPSFPSLSSFSSFFPSSLPLPIPSPFPCSFPLLSSALPPSLSFSLLFSPSFLFSLPDLLASFLEILTFNDVHGI